MARQTITIDTQGDWETGEFDGTNPMDPAGSLTLGIDTTRIAEMVTDGGLAVYCRCYEGSGATANNVGLAGNAALAGHAWVERDDGRSWLSGGNATVANHDSMRIIDSYDKYRRASGGVRIKYSVTGTLMTRAANFILGIDGTGHPYISWNYEDGWETVASAAALEAGAEHAISFTFNSGTAMLYVDGVIKATMFESEEEPVEIGTDNLVVSYGGYWTDFYYFGDGASGQAFDRQSTGGWWKTVSYTHLTLPTILLV